MSLILSKKCCADATKAVVDLFGNSMIVRVVNTHGHVMAISVWGAVFCPEQCLLKAEVPNDRLQVHPKLSGGQVSQFQLLNQRLELVFVRHCHVDDDSPHYQPGDCLPLAWIRDGIGFIV